MSIYRKLRFAFFVASLTSTASLSQCDSARQVASEITQFFSASVTRDSSEEGATANPPYDEVAAAVVEGARSLFQASTAGGRETVENEGGRDEPTPVAGRDPSGRMSSSARTGLDPTSRPEPGKRTSSREPTPLDDRAHEQ